MSTPSNSIVGYTPTANNPTACELSVMNGSNNSQGIFIGYEGVSSAYPSAPPLANAQIYSVEQARNGVYLNDGNSATYPNSGYMYITMYDNSPITIYSCCSGGGGGYSEMTDGYAGNTGSGSAGSGGYLYKIIINNLIATISNPITFCIITKIYNNGVGGIGGSLNWAGPVAATCNSITFGIVNIQNPNYQYISNTTTFNVPESGI